MRDTRTAPRRTSRRQWLAAALPLLGAGRLVASGAGMARAASAMDVWKAPDCGCFQHWVQHMQANGFELAVHDTGNNPLRARPWRLAGTDRPGGPPGLGGPESGRRHPPYDVLLIAHDGSARVFNSPPAPGQHHRQPCNPVLMPAAPAAPPA